jgi:hypothetical protein
MRTSQRRAPARLADARDMGNQRTILFEVLPIVADEEPQ